MGPGARAHRGRRDEIVLSKDLARRGVTLEIAQALKVTERRVWAVVFESETLQERTPLVWEAFRDGDLDAGRASAIADTAERLVERESWARLERSVIDYAATHTLGELRTWLRRFRARVEPEETAVETAKAEPRIHPETGVRDTRTRDQKQADILGRWLTSCTGTTTDIRAEIAISIAATDLVGYTEWPGLTRDGEPLDAAWVRELAASEHTVFRRLVLDPVGRVMDTTVLAYRPTESLRRALHWRDGTCRVAGCRAPVFETDLDHAKDYDSGGETSARNLRCLCRKHHNMKSHGHLDDRFLGEPATYGSATP